MEKIEQQKEQLPQVIRFLLGECEMDGVWYSESPLSKTPFWWRKKLREAWESKSKVSDSEIEKAALPPTDDDIISEVQHKYSTPEEVNAFLKGARWLRSQLNTGTSQNITE